MQLAEMEKFAAIPTFVFLLSTAVQYCSCERFNIIPTADSPCPGEFTGEPCLTLQQYVANPSLSSNITLELHSGNHRLDSQLSAADINSFTMRANATATVNCSQYLQSASYYWFSLERAQQLHVSGITFIGCRVYLNRVTNATFVRNSFVNRTRCCATGGVLYIQSCTSVTITQCNISNNRVYYGAIYGSRINSFTVEESNLNNNYYPYSSSSSHGGAIYYYYGNISILKSNFSGNRATRSGYGGAVYVSDAQKVTINNTHFNSNTAGYQGGAVYVSGGQVNITNSNFSNNIAVYSVSGSGGALSISSLQDIKLQDIYFINNSAGTRSGNGGAVYINNGQELNINNAHFINNKAGFNIGNGGAVYFNGGNITATNSTFINNTVLGGGGGAIHSVRRYTNVTLTNNTFSYNTAAYCGVMDIDEFFHNHVYFIGNTFTYNRAVGLVAGNNGGGVICIRNASISLMDNNFSHNTATGDAGVIRVGESDVTVQTSIFSNNTARGDGGVFHTYFYPSTYTISHTSFSDNQAGGDGGVMYVGRAGSHVAISQSTFTFNSATNRGGVLAVIGTTVHINGATISDNTAQLGEVVSACNSNVTISDPQISPTQDPVYPFCFLYDSSNGTVSRTTPQTPSITDTTTNPLTETATTTQQDSTTTTLSPPDEVTSTQPTTITTTPPTTVAITNEQTTTPTFTTTEDSAVAMTTTTMEEMSTISSQTTLISKIDTSTTMSPTTDLPPKQESSTVVTNEEETSTRDSKTDSSDSIPTTIRIVTRPADRELDSADLNTHHLPVYISLGISVVLMLLILLIIFKVFRVKSETHHVKRYNLNENAYPTLKNEYTLPDV